MAMAKVSVRGKVTVNIRVKLRVRVKVTIARLKAFEAACEP